MHGAIQRVQPISVPGSICYASLVKTKPLNDMHLCLPYPSQCTSGYLQLLIQINLYGAATLQAWWSYTSSIVAMLAVKLDSDLLQGLIHNDTLELDVQTA